MGVEVIAIIVLFAMLAVLIVVEVTRPARTFEDVPGWRLKCGVFALVLIAISVVVPFMLARPIANVRLLPGHELGIAGGAVAAIIASELVVYWAHRLHHRVPVLWRWIHQLHHSAERMDVFGAAYFHPLEILEGSIVGAILLNVVFGVTPESAAIATIWQAFAGVFQHGNIKTPTWLGYIIQRPEAHGIHHQRGVHGFNYANLPLWDIVFGTFRNPAAWQGEAGFYSGASQHTVAMLMGRDISQDRPRT